jgi:hypothetical protein
VKPPLEFFDMKTKSKFTSSEWRVETKEVKGKPRYFAVAKAPAGHEAWRVLSPDVAKANM